MRRFMWCVMVCSGPALAQEGVAPRAPLQRVAESDRAAVREALVVSGTQHAEWLRLLREVPDEQVGGAVFLLRTLAAHDLRTLTADFVKQHLTEAYRVRGLVPWREELTDDLFFEYVLPIANINERREAWRADFARRFLPVVADLSTPGEAAVRLNTAVFEQTGVRYHPTRRPKPDQSPSESIAAGTASCTGLSILLIDACRSVGVPARFAGTPSWTSDTGNTHPGNHSWVEVWDGAWHFLGASEPGELDHTWFFANASQPEMENAGHGVFAVGAVGTTTHFPMVWAEGNRSVAAHDVTLFYTARTPVTFEVRAGAQVVPAQVTVHTAGRLVARGPSTRVRPYPLAAGLDYRVTVHPSSGEPPMIYEFRLDAAMPQPIVVQLSPP